MPWSRVGAKAIFLAVGQVFVPDHEHDPVLCLTPLQPFPLLLRLAGKQFVALHFLDALLVAVVVVVRKATEPCKLIECSPAFCLPSASADSLFCEGRVTFLNLLQQITLYAGFH